MSATETPLVTTDELNKILTAENAELRMREQIAKAANYKMRAELAKVREQLAHTIETDETEAAMDAEDKRKLRSDLAARDALIGDCRNLLVSFQAGAELWLPPEPVAPEHEEEAKALHGLFNRLTALLARTPADAGAELERLRAIESDLRRVCDLLGCAMPQDDYAPSHEVERVVKERDALRAQLATENQRRVEAEMQATRDAKRADENAAQLAAVEADRLALREQRDDETRKGQEERIARKAAEARVRELEAYGANADYNFEDQRILRQQAEGRLAAVLGALRGLVRCIDENRDVREAASPLVTPSSPLGIARAALDAARTEVSQ